MRKIMKPILLTALAVLLTSTCIGCSDSGHSGNETGSASDESKETSVPPKENEPIDRTADDLITVDFSSRENYQLLKRQNVFCIGGGVTAFANTFDRDVKTLSALRAENVRIDFSMGFDGGLSQTLGKASSLLKKSEFTVINRQLKKTVANGTMPYLCYCYMPKSLQTGGDPMNPPSDYDGWKDVCRQIAGQFRSNGFYIPYHEVWNEPDCYSEEKGYNIFFHGTWDEYLKMYEYASKGILEGDPDALIGGLSAAYAAKSVKDGKVKAFLDNVKAKDLPLDFVSFHNYEETYLMKITLMNNILKQYGDRFSTVGLHLNEFHVTGNWSPLGSSSYKIVPKMWKAITDISENPCITSVNWAAWRDSGVEGEKLGFVDTATGKRYAPYHVLSIYNNMPVIRVGVKSVPSLESFASVDTDRAGVVIYNTSTRNISFTAALDSLPFDAADIKVYLIDEEHSSYVDTEKGDGLECIYEAGNLSSKDLSYSGSLKRYGTLYIEITEHGSKKSLPDVWNIDEGKMIAGGKASVVKKEYLFVDRNDKTYSEFDLGSFTAYVGMGDAKDGIGAGYVLLENLPEKFTVTPEIWGALEKQGTNSVIYLKVERLAADGSVTDSTVYKYGDGKEITLPWSSENAGNTVETDGKTPFEVTFGDGVERARISYVISDFGTGSAARFIFE